MFKYLAIFILALPFIGSGSFRATPHTANPLDLDDEEYAVFAAYVGDSDFTVILDHTVKNRFGLVSKDPVTVKREIPSISQQTLDDYHAKNLESYQLNRRLKIKGEYLFISDEGLAQIFRGHDLRATWRSFEQKYPKAVGYDAFSRVGFSADRKEALLYTESFCGSLCGHGHYNYFLKEDGKWKLIKWVGVWIS